LTREEIGEALTHLAFYASWPSAITASRKFLDLVNEIDGADESAAGR
jgi:4-carboxymuconolactone decarboxylase